MAYPAAFRYLVILSTELLYFGPGNDLFLVLLFFVCVSVLWRNARVHVCSADRYIGPFDILFVVIMFSDDRACMCLLQWRGVIVNFDT